MRTEEALKCQMQTNAAGQWIDNYYVDTSGAMMTNSRTPDGYYVGSDGHG